MTTALLELVCGDDPAAWRDLGFAVGDDGSCAIGALWLRIDGAGGGLRGWVLGGRGGPGAVDGIPTTWRDGHAVAPGEHPNEASALDHVVVLSDSRDRTVAALTGAGGDLRRSGGPPQLPGPMAFVRLGAVIVEIAEDPSTEGAALWGLTAVVPDVDALAARYCGLLGEPKAAVQAGRRIVTAARRPGLGTALAFMTPR